MPEEIDFDAMFNENDDVFDGLDDVETWDRLPWFKPDHQYTLQVDSVAFTKNDENIRFYIIHFTILDSTCEELPVGSRAAHTIKCHNEVRLRALGRANFKQFLAGVTGFPAGEAGVPWGEIAKMAISEGTLNGEKVRLQTNMNKKKSFTNHVYSPFSP